MHFIIIIIIMALRVNSIGAYKVTEMFKAWKKCIISVTQQNKAD